MRGILWSTAGILALCMVGMLLGATLVQPDPPGTPGSVRSAAIRTYIEMLRGTGHAPPERGEGVQACMTVILVDANKHIERLALPETVSVCEVVR